MVDIQFNVDHEIGNDLLSVKMVVDGNEIPIVMYWPAEIIQQAIEYKVEFNITESAYKFLYAGQSAFFMNAIKLKHKNTLHIIPSS